eukprot:8533817-Ditylum_brightwellii.AAC.1
MPQTIKSQQFKDQEIQQINYCHLYLNTTALADIMDARGNFLDPRVYHGQLSILSSKANSMRVKQAKSGVVIWQLWRKAMAIWADGEILQKPLGPWYYSGDMLERQWQSYYEFTLDSLYVHLE